MGWRRARAQQRQRLVATTKPPPRPIWPVRPVSLQDHLHEQARCLRLSETDQAALYFLIESLNDDGYLEDDWTELAIAFWRLVHGREAPSPSIAAIETAEAQLRTALGWLHNMEPTGCGRAGSGRMFAAADRRAAQQRRRRVRRW